MREIIFRGKSPITKEWIYGDLFQHGEQRFVMAEGRNTEVEPKTVGQFTGLTDENGVKIFENGYMIIDNKTYKVIFDNAEYILTNIFNCDIITLKNNSIKGVFVDEI